MNFITAFGVGCVPELSWSTLKTSRVPLSVMRSNQAAKLRRLLNSSTHWLPSSAVVGSQRVMTLAADRATQFSFVVWYIMGISVNSLWSWAVADRYPTGSCLETPGFSMQHSSSFRSCLRFSEASSHIWSMRKVCGYHWPRSPRPIYPFVCASYLMLIVTPGRPLAINYYQNITCF
jgi:hypothetical protein